MDFYTEVWSNVSVYIACFSHVKTIRALLRALIETPAYSNVTYSFLVISEQRIDCTFTDDYCTRFHTCWFVFDKKCIFNSSGLSKPYKIVA